MEVSQFRWCHIPYPVVRDLLVADPVPFVTPAAEASALHGHRKATTELEAEVAGIDVSATVEVEIGDVEDKREPVEILTIPLRWRAADHAGLFPVMNATLEVYPVEGDLTQLGFQGFYQPPLGPLGVALDVLALHRVAESTVAHFLDVVAHAIRRAVRASQPTER